MQIPGTLAHDLWSQVLTVAQFIVVGGVSYTARKMYTLDQRVQRVETILSGVDGENGIRGEVKDLKATRDRQEKALVRIETHLGIEERS